jgi:RNA polymerase sigma factor (TIGR02999 family)
MENPQKASSLGVGQRDEILLFAEQPMVDDDLNETGEIVRRVDGGGSEGQAAADELVPVLYRELRKLAQWQMGRGTPGVTLQPTALVHEAYIRLADQSKADWRSRTHFIAVASKVMRNLLIDHARAKAAEKRGGGWKPVTLMNEAVGGRELDVDQMLALDQALQRLAERDERQARVVELRFFGGLKVAEVAESMEVSQRTAEGLWTHARAWLLRELSREGER